MVRDYKSKHSHYWKPFSESEKNVIEKRLKENWPIKHIADELGRAKSSVFTEIKNNGGREMYSVQASMERMKFFKQKQNKRIPSTLGKSTIERLEAIEMQLEIIIETLKELKNDNSKN